MKTLTKYLSEAYASISSPKWVRTSTSDELNEASEAISARSNDTLKSGKSDNKEHKKGEVLHISCAHLNDVNISKQVNVGFAHNFCYNRQTCFLSCLKQQGKTFLL